MNRGNNKKNVTRQRKKDIVNMWLDKYDEIFSDFDPSPYAQRAISDDFIAEAKKTCSGKDKAIREFNLLLPEQVRDEKTEIAVSERLHSYFRNKLHQYNINFKETQKKGILLSISGIILLAILTYLLSVNIFSPFIKIIFTIIEPAGWFLIWIGLDYFFFTNKSKKPDRDFYKKVAAARIQFHRMTY